MEEPKLYRLETNYVVSYSGFVWPAGLVFISWPDGRQTQLASPTIPTICRGRRRHGFWKECIKNGQLVEISVEDIQHLAPHLHKELKILLSN